MDDAPRPGSVSLLEDPDAFEYTTDYLRRLLIERHAIRSALTNPGGSIILSGLARAEESSQAYSSVIGNDFHLDLVRVEDVLKQLPKGQRDALLSWADGLSSQQAAYFFNVRPGALRKRRERGVEAVARKMNEEGAEPRGAGRAGQRPAGRGRKEDGNEPQASRHPEPRQAEADRSTRDTHEFSAPE